MDYKLQLSSLIPRVIERFGISERKIGSVTYCGVRIMQCIFNKCSYHNEVVIPRKVIAEYLGMSINTVNDAIKRLTKLGLIHVSKEYNKGLAEYCVSVNHKTLSESSNTAIRFIPYYLKIIDKGMVNENGTVDDSFNQLDVLAAIIMKAKNDVATFIGSELAIASPVESAALIEALTNMVSKGIISVVSMTDTTTVIQLFPADKTDDEIAQSESSSSTGDHPDESINDAETPPDDPMTLRLTEIFTKLVEFRTELNARVDTIDKAVKELKRHPVSELKRQLDTTIEEMKACYNDIHHHEHEYISAADLRRNNDSADMKLKLLEQRLSRVEWFTTGIPSRSNGNGNLFQPPPDECRSAGFSTDPILTLIANAVNAYITKYGATSMRGLMISKATEPIYLKRIRDVIIGDISVDRFTFNEMLQLITGRVEVALKSLKWE